MPNWCENYLIVGGPEEAVKEWEEALMDSNNEEHTLSFNKLVPLPEEEKDNWYDWQVQNWGTKWDIGTDSRPGIFPEPFDECILLEGYGFAYQFSTAWSPPIEWLKAVAIMFPELQFNMEYSEPGMCYAGIIDIQGEEVEELYCGEFPEVHEFMLEHFGYSHWDEEDVETYYEDEQEERMRAEEESNDK